MFEMSLFNIFFIFYSLLIVLVVKVTQLKITSGNKNLKEYLLSPYFAISTLQTDKPQFNQNYLYYSFRTLFFFATTIYLHNIINQMNVDSYSFGYLLIALYIYFLLETIGANLQIIFLLFSEKLYQSIHNSPLLSKNVTEFWSTRWNKWVRDWLTSCSSAFISKFNISKIYRMPLSLTLSGIFHEVIINLPIYLFYQENHFGNMLVFFQAQIIFLIIDRKIKTMPVLRYLLFITCIVLFSKVFINRSLLLILGFE